VQNKILLLAIVSRAALLTTGLFFGLVVAVHKIATTAIAEEVLGVTAAFIASSIAAWWAFRKLQPHYTKREARHVAVAIAVFTPVFLAVAMPLSLFGGYAAFLGRPFGLDSYLALAGTLAAAVVITAMLSFLACLLALIARHAGRLDQSASQADKRFRGGRTTRAIAKSPVVFRQLAGKDWALSRPDV
jgi:hypothetical protein